MKGLPRSCYFRLSRGIFAVRAGSKSSNDKSSPLWADRLRERYQKEDRHTRCGLERAGANTYRKVRGGKLGWRRNTNLQGNIETDISVLGILKLSN